MTLTQKRLAIRQMEMEERLAKVWERVTSNLLVLTLLGVIVVSLLKGVSL